MLVGAVNGLLITRLNVAPFIATLGTLYVARGPRAALVGRRHLPEPQRQPRLRLGELPRARRGQPPRHHLADLDHDRAGAAPRPTWRARTPLGRYIYAVGGNERSAALSGVKVNRVKMFVYMFSGFCAAIVGLIITSQLVAAHPATGETFELNAIAAAVLGGTSMSGGRGRIGGTMIGAFVIGILADGLVMMGVSSFWQTVIKGLVIIAAVVVDQAQQRLQANVAPAPAGGAGEMTMLRGALIGCGFFADEPPATPGARSRARRSSRSATATRSACARRRRAFGIAAHLRRRRRRCSRAEQLDFVDIATTVAEPPPAGRARGRRRACT